MMKKTLKLLVTVVGLVVVLVGLMAMPGVTQSSFSRQALVNALNAEVNALLTAGTGELLNVEASTFFSSRRATSAYIPPHPSALSARLIRDFLVGQAEWIFLGAVYVSADIPKILPKGFYYIRAINKEQVALVSLEGEVAGTRKIRWLREPTEVAALYDHFHDKEGTYFVLSVRTGGDPGSQFVMNGGGSGGTPPGTSPPPPPQPPSDDDGISWTVSIGVCAPIPIIEACITFAETHI